MCVCACPCVRACACVCVAGASLQGSRGSKPCAPTFMNAFEPSSWAACFEGPQQGMLAASRSSARPATSGASGPTTTRSTPFSLQKLTTCSKATCSGVDIKGKCSRFVHECPQITPSLPLTSPCFDALRATLVTFSSSSVPGLPGAMYTPLVEGAWAMRHASECSRPPPPTTSTFTWRYRGSVPSDPHTS
jgi:exodeoxyribonuclease VII large subunit